MKPEAKPTDWGLEVEVRRETYGTTPCIQGVGLIVKAQNKVFRSLGRLCSVAFGGQRRKKTSISHKK